MKATIGTVIHATLRNEDLLEAFSDELKAIDNDGHYIELIAECKKHMEILNNRFNLDDEENDDFNRDDWEEIASYLVNEDLFDALNNLALPYTYFGCTEGDGSDFGFWPSIESVEEDVHCNEIETDLTQIPQFYVDINDHGNTTLYQFDIEDMQYKVIWDVV